MPEHHDRPTGRRAEVLRLLRDEGTPMGIAAISERLGVHANTVRFHLETLVENGQVERATAERRTPGRPPQMYEAVPGMDPAGPRHFRVLAEVLATTLAAEPDAAQRAVEAGRLWGNRQAAALASASGASEPIASLIQMLDELDFAPELPLDGGRSRIGLRNCPFLELATSHAQIACPVHLGLMRGAMESWNAPVTVDRLDAFVEPDLCVAHLTSKGVS